MKIANLDTGTTRGVVVAPSANARANPAEYERADLAESGYQVPAGSGGVTPTESGCAVQMESGFEVPAGSGCVTPTESGCAVPAESRDMVSAQSVCTVPAASVIAVPTASGYAPSGLSDAELQEQIAEAFTERRRLDARIVHLSGEIAMRSRPELGSDGLARRNGSSNAAALIASLGLISMSEAGRFQRVGTAIAPRTALSGEVLPPVFGALSEAIGAGSLAVEAAAHIVSQLDQARPRSNADDLAVAERELVAFAAEATADDVRRLSIRWRDALDVDGIEPREEALVAARSLKRIVLPNGMKRFVIDLDPLSAAYLDTAIDAEVTASIRTVRFAPEPDVLERSLDTETSEGESRDLEEPESDDPPTDLGPDARTLRQMGADAIIDLARHALSCENTTPALAAATVVVRMSEESLVSGLGEAQIDGGEQPISAGTARRLAAEGEIIPMVLGGDSEVLDLGRSRRVFTRAQRIAFAERDGGCAVRGCERPPSHTEAHHIRWWVRDRGPSNLDNGVLLCTRDHRRVHAQNWDIRLDHGRVWFIPPPSVDPQRRPRPGGRVPIPRLEGGRAP